MNRWVYEYFVNHRSAGVLYKKQLASGCSYLLKYVVLNILFHIQYIKVFFGSRGFTAAYKSALNQNPPYIYAVI